MLKKLNVLFLISVMTLLSCSNSNSGDKAASGDGKKIRVALVLAGFLGDKSFNDSSYIGAQQAQKDFGVEVKVMESKVPAEWESNLLAMASDNYDLVLGVSTQLQDIINKHASSFPNIKFALIDGVADEGLTNVISSIFAQNEGSFLAGAVAAMFTTNTSIPNVNAEKIVGWVGGMDIPVLADFYTGFKQGVEYIDPQTKILQSFAGTFNDPLKGKELTIAQYSQGADIVMNVASGTGNGVLEASKEQNRYAIGVDLDQDSTYPGHIVTSMLKRVDRATYLAIESVVNNTFNGGEVIYLDIANGGVGLTDMSVLKESLADKFPSYILDEVKNLEEKVKNGEIVVNYYQGFGNPKNKIQFLGITLNYILYFKVMLPTYLNKINNSVHIMEVKYVQ
ncbi:BMP family ABC transporter substrate-binding protein [Brachyspira hyodysenteriae]|nr:BMP family ABC transporter substrate-binding protein [Brachyspira hyodysenteriae]MDA1470222.1 BMP family ABC transporter substrate-binding protein [Brachyspira hyodysenteriae]